MSRRQFSGQQFTCAFLLYVHEKHANMSMKITDVPQSNENDVMHVNHLKMQITLKIAI